MLGPENDKKKQQKNQRTFLSHLIEGRSPKMRDD